MPACSGRMNSLSHSATLLPGHGSLEDSTQADPDSEDATTTALMEQQADDDGGGGDSGGGSRTGAGVVEAAMSTAVVNRLLQMGLQEDGHAETVVKVHALSTHCSW